MAGEYAFVVKDLCKERRSYVTRAGHTGAL